MELTLDKPQQIFDNRTLMRLLIPLMLEQILAVSIGMISTVMVGHLGDAAISAVTLVDSINILMTQVFAALATGGAVVAAQYLGHRDQKSACDTARQLVHTALLAALFIMTVILLFNRNILNLVAPQAEEEILSNAEIFFALTAISFPFLALYNASAALFRAMGNSKISMFASVLMNITNVLCNTLTIRQLQLGVTGAGISLIVARILGACLMMYLITRYTNPIYIDKLFKPRFRWASVKRILSIGIPNGIENSLFQIGKLLVLGLISSFSVASSAANGLGNTLSSLTVIPGSACSLALITVVGQCMGAGQPDQAAQNTKKIIKIAMGSILLTSSFVLIFLKPLIAMFGLSPDASAIAAQIMTSYCLLAIIFWPLSFTLPNALRGAGDGRFTVIVSFVSIAVFRVFFSYVFGAWMGMGLVGVWYGMYVDWFGRGTAFVWRFASGRWKTRKVI